MAGDPYSELGVKRDASDADIQKAFRKLAKELHPDKNPGNKASEERFKRVSAAFDFLKDPDKRRKFDRGEMDADGREIFRGFGGGGAGARPGAAGASGKFEGMDFEDIFDMFGAGGARRPGAGGFSGGFGGSPFGASAPPPKGNDFKIKLDIDLLDTIVGNTRRVLFSDGRTVDVNIPKGSKDGQTLRLKGQGAQPAGGRGTPGDALVELHIKPHPVFRLDGNDLHMDLYVSLPDALLGGKIQAPTPDGPVSVTLAAGSNSGAVLRLKGRGAFHKDGQRGDLFAHVAIALPDKMPDGMPDALYKDLMDLVTRWRDKAPYAPSPGARKK